jgi:hypothetical protein
MDIKAGMFPLLAVVHRWALPGKYHEHNINVKNAFMQSCFYSFNEMNSLGIT